MTNHEESTGFSVPPAAIVNQIRNLLRERYKEGFPIIKEIIQNANDGGATRLDIGITQGLKEVIHPLLRESALFFVNNGSFRDSDAQAIGWFGVDFNAGNTAKIGKFGLGQKSIFHFCEAFFYVAHSKELSSTHDRWRFLNPWADPINLKLPDAKHPDWRQLTQADKEIIEAYLRENELLGQEYDEYFILWLPLRSPLVKERCILPNDYNHQTIQDHLPRDMESRIATLMPMLRSLQTVHYWLSDENNKLQEAFRVHLDNSSQRCTYPRAEETVEDEIEQLLCGRIALNKHSVIYGGHESLLPASSFERLLPDSVERLPDFWTALRASEYWPQRSTQNEAGEPESVQDKAIPHCGVVFSRSPAQGKGRLTVQWAVFLPLMDDGSGSAEFEQVASEQNLNYTLLLHGYFFLDSGRRSIEAFADIYEDKVNREAVPTSDNQMVRLWNAILATEGTLSLVLPALKEFCDRHHLETQEVTDLCYLLQQSEIFRRETLENFVYSRKCWVYRLQPTQSSWQLVDRTEPILALPSIPNWKAFPKLSEIAVTHCLILAEFPNLMPPNKPIVWQDAVIEAVLNSLDINTVFCQATQLEFLVKWLQGSLQPFSDAVQDCLQAQLRKALVEGELELPTPIQRWMIAAISLLDESRWLVLESSDRSLLQSLNQELLSVLILPDNLSPQRRTSCKLSAQDAGVLISRLIDQSGNPDLIRQIVEVVPSEELMVFRSQVNAMQFIPGFDYRNSQNSLYTPQAIAALNQQGQLFVDSASSRHTALNLQQALRDRTVVLLDTLFTNKFCDGLVRECDRDACLMILQQRPLLSDCEDRIKLLESLLS